MPRVWRDNCDTYPPYDLVECEVLERNGNLTLVEIKETGETDWVSPFELDE